MGMSMMRVSLEVWRKGALEIKCPCSIGGNDTRNMLFNSICEQYPSFYLEQLNGGLQLKRSSKHYCQVQGEMALVCLPWVDFVSWNLVDIHIERMCFDVDFSEIQLLPKLEAFYKDEDCPSYF